MPAHRIVSLVRRPVPIAKTLVPLDSAIKVVHKPGDSYHNVITCLQCSEPACQEACTTGAIRKSKEDGVVRISSGEVHRLWDVYPGLSLWWGLYQF